ncbi:MAG: Ig-like domain-containing protein, partial [Acidimicrobiales bacterium]
NPLAPQTITFTTAGNTPPTVIAATPAANSVGLGRNDNATITFSEPIQGASAATAFLTRVSNGNVVVSVVTLNVAGNTITINPNGRLRANTQYQLNLVGGAAAIRDLDGQPLVTTSWTFTTGAA